MLVERGDLGRAVSTFPSLTPVCLSTIATGAGPRPHAHPRPAVVPPRRAALRRVRVVVPGDARRGRQAVGRRRGREPEPRPPLAQADDDLRGGRGRRHDRGLGQLPGLARTGAPLVQVPDARALRPAHRLHGRGLRPEPVLLRRAVRLRAHGRADEHRRGRRERRLRRPPSAAGSSRATASTSCSSTSPRPTRRAIAAATPCAPPPSRAPTTRSRR